MSNDIGSPEIFRRLVRWASTPPQIYVVYLVGLILVWLVSFYAGTLNPRKAPTAPGPVPPISAPRN